jgi:PST family polysaccharide transporter
LTPDYSAPLLDQEQREALHADPSPQPSRLRSILGRFCGSKFVRDSALLLAFTLLSRGIGFFASAYAARSLGPFKLGVSALIMATVAQVNLAFNGGFDTVAVRKIASNPESAGEVTSTVLGFRMGVAGLAVLLWLTVVLTIPDLPHRSAWLFGGLLVLTSASGLTFVFSGLEKLPIQNAIGTGGALLAALAYFVFFRPGIFLGADLVVAGGVGLVTTAFSWGAYRRILGRWPLGRTSVHQVRALLREGWRYWIAAAVGYLYSAFQIPLVAYISGAHDAGLYRTAFSMAAAVELVFGSINSLLLPRLIAWKQMGLDVLQRRQATLLAISVAVGLPPVALLAFTAPALFRLMLGPAFVEAIPVFQILVVGRLVVFCSQMYPFSLVALGRDTALLAMSMTSAVLSVSLTIFAAGEYGIVAVALVNVLVELFVGLACYFLVRASMARKSIL